MATFLDLPNCVLLHLLSYVDVSTLYSLSKTCERLEEIVKGWKAFWKHIDVRSSVSSSEAVTFYAERIHSNTRTFLVKGDSRFKSITNADFFTNLPKFDNLSVLALDKQLIRIDNKALSSVLPAQLHELSLKSTEIDCLTDCFRHTADQMQQLRVLILDDCQWLSTSALMSISKYESLEILSVYNCHKIDNSIPYLSLAGQYGFRNLKVLDVRLTYLGNVFVRSFYKSSSLLALYFQNRDISYQLDYFRRLLALEKASKCTFVDYEYEVSDLQIHNEIVNFYDNPSGLDDYGFSDYLSIIANRSDAPLPSSVLYTYPFSDTCTCRGSKEAKSTHSDDDDDSRPILGQLRRKIDDISDQIRRSNAHRVNSTRLERLPVRQVNSFRSLRNIDLQDKIGGSNARSILQAFSEGHPLAQVNCIITERPGEERPGPSNERPKRVHSPEGHQEGRRRRLNRGLMCGVRPGLVRLMHVDRMPQNNKVPLRCLSLRGYQGITDKVLTFINSLDLDLLDLTYTSCTAKGIDTYLVDHPFCRVVHKDFCQCQPNMHF